MNAAQEKRRAERQRAAVREMAGGDIVDDPRPPAEPPAPIEPFENVVAAARRRQLETLGLAEEARTIPVAYLRFTDRTFQLAGMQSGEQLHARAEPNGREHRIELVAGVNAFLVTHLDPARRAVVFEFVERTAVKTWRLAPSA